MRFYRWLFRFELGARFQNSQGVFHALFFFVLIASLFPLSIPASMDKMLTTVAPGVIWVAALLSILLSSDQLFKNDYRDGVLEQFMVSPHSLSLIVLVKIIAAWLMGGFLIACISPFIAYAMGVGEAQIYALVIGLMLGTLTTTLIGAVGAALTLTTGQGGMLVSLLVLPLYIPVLIFGAGMLADIPASATSLTEIMPMITAPLYMLGAMTVLSVALVPLVISLAFRHTLES